MDAKLGSADYQGFSCIFYSCRENDKAKEISLDGVSAGFTEGAKHILDAFSKCYNLKDLEKLKEYDQFRDETKYYRNHADKDVFEGLGIFNQNLKEEVKQPAYYRNNLS